jgi:hypothetical protein
MLRLRPERQYQVWQRYVLLSFPAAPRSTAKLCSAPFTSILTPTVVALAVARLAAGPRRHRQWSVEVAVAASTITNYTGTVTNPPLEAMPQAHEWKS